MQLSITYFYIKYRALEWGLHDSPFFINFLKKKISYHTEQRVPINQTVKRERQLL